MLGRVENQGVLAPGHLGQSWYELDHTSPPGSAPSSHPTCCTPYCPHLRALYIQVPLSGTHCRPFGHFGILQGSSQMSPSLKFFSLAFMWSPHSARIICVCAPSCPANVEPLEHGVLLISALRCLGQDLAWRVPSMSARRNQWS